MYCKFLIESYAAAKSSDLWECKHSIFPWGKGIHKLLRFINNNIKTVILLQKHLWLKMSLKKVNFSVMLRMCLTLCVTVIKYSTLAVVWTIEMLCMVLCAVYFIFPASCSVFNCAFGVSLSLPKAALCVQINKLIFALHWSTLCWMFNFCFM